MLSVSDRLLDDKTIELLKMLRNNDGRLLSQVIQDEKLKDMFDGDLDLLIARLQMLAAFYLVKFQIVIDEEDDEDIKITLTSLGRDYLESTLKG